MPETGETSNGIPSWHQHLDEGLHVGGVVGDPEVLMETVEAQTEFTQFNDTDQVIPSETHPGLDTDGNYIPDGSYEPTLQEHKVRITNAMDEPPYRR